MTLWAGWTPFGDAETAAHWSDPRTRTSGAITIRREEISWGDPLGGLRLRVSAPAGTEYRSRTALPLVLELENVGDRPVPFRSLGLYAGPEARDEAGRRLVMRAPIDIGPWAGRPDDLAPRVVIKWTAWFERMRYAKPLGRGDVVQLRFRLPARVEGPEGPKRAQRLIEVFSNLATLKINDPHPSRLAGPDDVPQHWTESMDIVFREDMGLAGWRLMHINGRGRTRLFRVAWGTEDPLIPWGCQMARLDRRHLDKLARVLHEQRIWELTKLPHRRIPTPEEGEIGLSFSSAGASLVREFPNGVVEKQPVLRALREEMHRLMTIVVAAEAKASEWGKAAEGVQVRLRAEKTTSSTADVPILKVDLRNNGKEEFHLIGYMVTHCYAHIDGVTYLGGCSAACPVPGSTVTGIPVKLAGSATMANGFSRVPRSSVSGEGDLHWSPGKHVVRVSFRMKPRGASDQAL